MGPGAFAARSWVFNFAGRHKFIWGWRRYFSGFPDWHFFGAGRVTEREDRGSIGSPVSFVLAFHRRYGPGGSLRRGLRGLP